MRNRLTNPPDDAMLDELGALFHCYEGPGHVCKRPKSDRYRVRAFAVVVTAAAIVAATGAIFAFHLTDSKSSTPAGLGLEMQPPVSLGELIDKAPIVFVGRITTIDENPVTSEGSLGVCPIHYEVEHAYRGDLGASADLGSYCGNEHFIFPAFPADVGKSYLVFAVPAWNTSAGGRILSPYSSGVYLVTGADTAENEVNGTVQTVHLDELAQRLASTHSQP